MNISSDRSDRAIATHVPIPVCLLRGETIGFANPAMGTLFGVEPAELEGTKLVDYLDDEAVAELSDALGGSGDGPVVRFELDRADRRSRTVEGAFREVEDGTGDRTLVGTFTDVSDRLADEHNSAMLDSLLEKIPLSIYFKDRQSRHERVSRHLVCQSEDVITNEEGKRHPHQDDVIGKTDWDIYGPEVAEEAIEEDREVMETETPIVEKITEATTSLGEPFAVSTTKAPRYDEDGAVVGVVGVTIDVTDRVQPERALRRQNERMEEFTEVLTHDLRNPLQVARGYVDLLEDRYDDPELETLGRSLDRIESLIEQSRRYVLEGRTVESPAPVALSAVARDAWDCVETAAATLDVTATHTVRADGGRLQRLFENLIRNAVEHARPDVTVTIGDLEDGFVVADDGPGIPTDYEATVFERGFTTAEDSTGFGLAIVETIARAHDWSVEATESAEGGARFEFHDVVRVDSGDQSGV